jgi:signal transduction histidine kinase
MHYNAMNGIKRNQAKYVFLSTLIGFGGGSIGFSLGYNINLYPLNPFSTYCVTLYTLIFAYAIVRYRLMDIKVAITSTGIFLTIYTAVLGIPFWLGFGEHQWMYSLLSMGVLATAGPFIYGKLKQQAERKILHKQIEYQHALRRLAKTITQVKDLDSLFDHIVTNVYDLVQPDYVAIYILSNAQKAYMLKIKRTNDHPYTKESFPVDSILVQVLNHDKKAIFSELVNDPAINETMIETILVPFFAEEKLYGVMVVGAKTDKSLYAQGDIEVFDILLSEMSIAVENLLFWKEEKSRIMREEQIRRQKAMDNFSASLAHEIDNPIFSVQCAIDALKQDIATTAKGLMPEDKLEYILATLTDIGQSTRRISKIIKAIREFSGKNTGEMKPLNMDDVIENLISIVGPQIKHENIAFNINISHDIFIEGNKIHLIELLMNLASNSIHAVKNNGTIDKKIDISLTRDNSSVCVVMISDNGYGIEPDLIEDIFLDFVTTKPSGEGSGMGLARCRKIAENHHGKIWAKSEGKGKGAAFFVELPLLK